MLPTVKYLCHEIGFITFKPTQTKITSIHKIPSPTAKIELMKFIGTMKFHSEFIDTLYVNMRPLYDLLDGNIQIHWNNELETMFQQIKTYVTRDVTLKLPNTNHPFLFTVDFP